MKFEEIQPKWIYNVETKKCLYSPDSTTSRPLLSNCDDSDYSKWIIVSTGDGYQRFHSKANPDLCLRIENNDKGTITIDYCDDKFDFTFGEKITYQDYAIRSVLSNKCLDIYNPNDINKNSFELNLNKCNPKNNLQNRWSLWDINPSESKIVWIQNKNTKKCQCSPPGFNERPLSDNCDNGDNSKWLISSSYKGYIRSVAHPDWCINLKREDGTTTLLKCGGDNSIFEYPTKPQYSIKPLNINKCLGFLDQNPGSRKKLFFNPCSKSNDDQQWEITEDP